MEMNKWKIPGWRIEQRYSRNVLIGNWNEERRKFKRGSHSSDSTHRADFKHNAKFQPDNHSRRSAVLQHEGLEKQVLFSHHGNQNYANHMISWYDQQYNGREKSEGLLPHMRKWDGKTMAYVPERSDHPLMGKPTEFGLLQKKRAKWLQQESESNIYNSTYSSSFMPYNKDAFEKKHFATPRALSSQLYSNNAINQNLKLRSRNAISKGPDYHAPDIITAL